MIIIIGLSFLYFLYLFFIFKYKKHKQASTIILPIPIFNMILSQILYVDFCKSYINHITNPSIILLAPLKPSKMVIYLLGNLEWKEYLLIAGNLLNIAFFSMILFIILRIIEIYNSSLKEMH